MGQPIFPPGTTRADIEGQISHENRIGLGLCAFLAGLALLAMLIDEGHAAVGCIILVVALAVGSQWEHGRRRSRFMLWEMQEKAREEAERKASRQSAGIPRLARDQ